MQSVAPTVAAYLDEVPPERHAALLHLRSLCLQHLSGFEEGMTAGVLDSLLFASVDIYR
jgi:hypothetical protein